MLKKFIFVERKTNNKKTGKILYALLSVIFYIISCATIAVAVVRTVTKVQTNITASFDVELFCVLKIKNVMTVRHLEVISRSFHLVQIVV
jgi:hypothetical protein